MADRISRRELLVGAAAVAAVPHVPVVVPAGDGELAAQATEFQELIDHITALEQRKDQTAAGVDFQLAWKAWSTAIDDAEALAAQIEETPAQSLVDLSLKVDALIWDISHDGLDDGVIDKLQAFGEELRAMISASDR